MVQRLGDTAYLVRDLPAPAWRVAAALRESGIPGLADAVACYDTVAVYVERGFDPAALAHLPAVDPEPSHIHRVPVCYELGEDLAEAADRLGLDSEALVRIHSGHVYDVRAVAFCPGFPYLGPIPEPIRGLPRLPSPRTRVEPGSVAIIGNQAGIYPLPRPGGWRILGRTPLTLVDVDAEYFPIQAGDRIVFERIGADDFRALLGERL